jgi:hypothetical protein
MCWQFSFLLLVEYEHTPQQNRWSRRRVEVTDHRDNSEYPEPHIRLGAALGSLVSFVTAMKAKNLQLASVFGWTACAVGGLVVFSKIVCYYVLATVGENPGTVIYVIRLLDADILAFIVGIPLGIYAWYGGRRGLGVAAVAMCGTSLALTLIRVLLGCISEIIHFL